MTDKAAMRRRMRGIRDGLDSELRAQKSATVCRMAERLIAPGSAVLAYAPVRSELDVWPLIRRLWEIGCKVCLPVTGAGGRMEAAGVEPGAALKLDRFGIPVPATLDVLAPDAIQVALIPGLAFDEQGGRLGYGAGYFDRYLARTDCLRVGLAFSEQLVPRVPIAPWDLAMDLVLTDEKALFPIAGRRRLRRCAPSFCEFPDNFSQNRAEF